MLDEPLSGTDPAQRLHLRDVVRGLAAEGRTILVSSHILEEVDELADRIHLMVSGKLAASGDYRAIRQKLERPAVRRPRRLRRPAPARRRARRGRGRRVGRDHRYRRPPRPEPRRRLAPAVAARRRARARSAPHARRAARRLARERLRVPRNRDGRMTAVFVLTVRQLAGSRRLWLVLGLVCLPVLAAVVFRVGDTTTTSDRFADNVTRTLIASAILPLVMLLFATSAFGNELVDRTLGYLALKPIARWRIVVSKLAAAFVVGGVPIALSGFVTVAVVDGDGMRGGRDGARPPRRRGGVRGALHLGGPRDETRAPSRARLRLRLGGDARRLSRRHPLPQHPPLHAVAHPRARRRAARDARQLALRARPRASARRSSSSAFTALTVRKLTRMDVP